MEALPLAPDDASAAESEVGRVELADLPAPSEALIIIPLLLFAVLASITAWGMSNLRIPKRAASAQYARAAAPDTAGSQVMNLPETSETQTLAPFFAPPVLAWEGDILRWAQAYDLPPNLIAVVMQIESCGFRKARSRAGAIGLFQVMPYHFASGEDSYNPEVNAARGLTYLARAYQLADGDVARTLAGYNGGHGVIDLPKHAWPQETQRYVRWGLGIWEDAQLADLNSEALESWLSAGGASLCRRASAASAEDKAEF